MRILPALLLCLSLIPGLSFAQERPNTILVLDGSGSMWGQIDGVNKIVIARDVVGQILAGFPPEENLGLTVYGHRERGNCADIETIVAPAPNTASEILKAVKAINPRGKTPMTDAIIAAAEALRYTEEAATVILVSDGIETCNPDPCAAARALEEAGIDFTAHVVGFDVSDADALKQMQCISAETGGEFLTASNADELFEALNEVTKAAPPEPILTPIEFRATLGEGGADITPQVLWDISGTEGLLIDDAAASGSAFTADLEVGTYTAIARDPAEGSEGTVDFTVTDAAQTVIVVLPVPLPDATITAQETAPLGSTIPLEWTGPNAEGDYVSVASLEQGATAYVNYTYIRDLADKGLQMPPSEGTFELRYVSSETNTVLATRAITITPIEVSLTAPEMANVGEKVAIEWTGPAYERDYISVAKVGVSGSQYENYTYVREGNPLSLLMPSETGEYEIRYIMAQDNTIMASTKVTVEEVGATLTAPETAAVGETVSIEWTGPAYERDYISVAKVGVSGSQYENYTYVREGNPLPLLMPSETGEYEIRYIMAQDNTIMASTKVTVEEVGATLAAPETAKVGETISVDWTGPAYERDYISVAKVGVSGSQYENYTYVREGKPLPLLMPSEPGNYEIRYILAQDSTIIASAPITVEEVGATLTAPATAAVGDTISIDWTGPAYERDYISIAEVGVSGSQYENYTYVREGNPLPLLMPSQAGDYEVRYILAQDSVVLTSQPITVEQIEARLVAAPTIALSAGEIIVEWEGPDYPRDYIGISKPDEDGYQTYSYANTGNPLTVKLPKAAGEYEIRYFMTQDRAILGRIPLTVTAD